MQWATMVATTRLIDQMMKNSLCLTCVAWSLTVNSKYRVVGRFEEIFPLPSLVFHLGMCYWPSWLAYWPLKKRKRTRLKREKKRKVLDEQPRIIGKTLLLLNYHGLRDKLSSLFILSTQKLHVLSSFLRYAASCWEASWYFFNTFPYFLLTVCSYSFFAFSASSSFFANLTLSTFTCVFIFSSKLSLCDAYSLSCWMSDYRNLYLSLRWIDEANSAALRKFSECIRAYLRTCMSFWVA